MARKKKPEQETAPAAVPSTADWEQTLVAAEAPPEPPEPLLEPLEPLPPPEPLEPVGATTEAEPLEPVPEFPAEPEPMEEAGFDVPEEFRKHVRSDGATIVLKESYLNADMKRRLEDRMAPGRAANLVEKRWIPAHRTLLHEIHNAVDRLQWSSRYQPKAVAWIERNARASRQALRGLERVPANIVSKRVVYETEGGFVVEVAYRELGQVHHRLYSVPATGSHAAALAQVRSGALAQATVVNPDLVDVVARGTRKGGARVRPGRVTTWPLANRHPVFDISGINRKRAAALNRLGIETTDQFRVYPARALARHMGAPESVVSKMQDEAELLLVSGLGPKYAHVLVEADVRGLEGLRSMTAAQLMKAANDVIGATKSRSKPNRIGRAKASDWIKKAKRARKTSQPFPV